MYDTSINIMPSTKHNGNLVIKVLPNKYNFIPRFLVYDKVYNVPFGDEILIPNLGRGSYYIGYLGHTDHSHNYIAHISENPINICSNKTTYITVRIEAIPISFNKAPRENESCYDIEVSESYGNIDYIHLNLKNLDHSINIKTIKFEFNNEIVFISPESQFTKDGEDYEIHFPNGLEICSEQSIPLTIFYHMDNEPELEDIYINGKPLCSDTDSGNPTPPVLKGHLNISTEYNLPFTPEVLVNGVTYRIEDSSNTIIDLYPGTYTLAARCYEDNNHLYTPVLSEEESIISTDQTTYVNLHYRKIEKYITTDNVNPELLWKTSCPEKYNKIML